MGKDACDIAVNHKPVNQPSAGRGVLDCVFDQGAAAVFFEAMGVPPQTVGPANLTIYEAKRGFPDLDLGSPANRHSVPPEPVIDQGSRRDLDRCGSQYLELKP